MDLKVEKYDEGGGVWTINAKTDKQIVCELRGPARTLSKLKVSYTTSHSVKIIPAKNFNYQINAIIRDGGSTPTTVRISNVAPTAVQSKFKATSISLTDHSALIDVNYDRGWMIANTDSTSNLIIESNGNSVNILSPNGEKLSGRVINIIDSTGEAHTVIL